MSCVNSLVIWIAKRLARSRRSNEEWRKVKRRAKKFGFFVLVFSLPLFVPRAQLSERLQQATARFIITNFVSLGPLREETVRRGEACRLLISRTVRTGYQSLVYNFFICYSCIRFHLVFFFCSSVRCTVSGFRIDILPTHRALSNTLEAPTHPTPVSM